MSIAALHWVISEIKAKGLLDGLGLAERYVLVHLADRANPATWRCFPSHKTLARELEVSPRSVQTYLGRLEDRGLISREPRFRPNGERSSDIILVNPELAAKIAASEDGEPIEPTAKISRPTAKSAAQETLKVKPRDKGLEGEGGREVVVVKPIQEQAVEVYNALAERCDWPAAKLLNDVRRKAISNRIKDAGGFAPWRDIMLTAETSDFLRGKSGGLTAWKPSLDFFLQASSFAKLAEGKYHERNGRHDQRQPIDPRGDARAASHDRRTSNMLAGASLALDEIRRERAGGN